MSPQLRALQDYEPADADHPALEPAPADVPAPRAVPRTVAVLNARQLLMFVVEAVDGRRPLAQLTGLLTSAAMEEVSRVVAPGRHARLGTLHTCRVSTLAVEIAATVTQNAAPQNAAPQKSSTRKSTTRNTRVRALAARVELHDDTWKCALFRLLP